MSNSNGSIEYSKSNEATITSLLNHFETETYIGTELPTIEVYVAVCFSRTPIMMNFSPKHDQQVCELVGWSIGDRTINHSLFHHRLGTTCDLQLFYYSSLYIYR